MKALMVVDICHGDGWKPEDIKRNTNKEQVLSHIKRAVNFVRNEKLPRVFIIFVPRGKEIGQQAQFCFQDKQNIVNPMSLLDRVRASSCMVCEIPNYRLSKELEHQHNGTFEPAFIKAFSNSFTNEKLAPYLTENGINEVVLAGCNTEECVYETAKGAVEHGFNVTLLEDCTFPPFASEGSKKKWARDVEQIISRDCADNRMILVRVLHSQTVYPDPLPSLFFV